MIKNIIQYQCLQESIQRRSLRVLSVRASVRRFLELVKAGWQFVPPMQRPMPIGLIKLLSALRP